MTFEYEFHGKMIGFLSCMLSHGRSLGLEFFHITRALCLRILLHSHPNSLGFQATAGIRGHNCFRASKPVSYFRNIFAQNLSIEFLLEFCVLPHS